MIEIRVRIKGQADESVSIGIDAVPSEPVTNKELRHATNIRSMLEAVLMNIGSSSVTLDQPTPEQYAQFNKRFEPPER